MKTTLIIILISLSGTLSFAGSQNLSRTCARAIQNGYSESALVRFGCLQSEDEALSRIYTCYYTIDTTNARISTGFRDRYTTRDNTMVSNVHNIKEAREEAFETVRQMAERGRWHFERGNSDFKTTYSIRIDACI